MRSDTKLLIAAAIGAGLVLIRNTIPSKKSTALERRYAANFPAVWNELNSLAATVAGHTVNINSLLNLNPLLGDVTFLANLSMLSHQSDNNTTLSGVENYCNNLTDNLIANGFMH